MDSVKHRIYQILEEDEVDKTHILCEMPQLASPVEFGLEEEEQNTQFAQELLANHHEVLEETPTFILLKTGKDQTGYIAYITKGATPIISLLSSYKTLNKKLTGKTVTQILLWRNRLDAATVGMPKKIIFDHMLKSWPAIMSDAVQTEAGKQFWISRMNDAVNQCLKIGYADFNIQKVVWYDASTPISTWLQNKNLWGTHKKYNGIRCLISN